MVSRKSTDYIPNIAGTVDDIKRETDKLVKDFESTVNKNLTEAQKVLEESKKKVKDNAASVSDAAKKEMQKSEKKVKEELEELKKKAANAGVNIENCFHGQEERLIKLSRACADSMAKCLSDKIKEGVTFTQNTLTRIQTVTDEVKNIRKELRECGSGLKAMKCLVELVERMEDDISSLPKMIKDDVADALFLMNKIEHKLELCGADNVERYRIEAERLYAGVSACVHSRIYTKL